jgi:hypothetical protein
MYQEREEPKVCGSKLEPDGKVVITTPSPGCCVGEVLFVIGSAAEFMTERADWIERLVHPPANGGRPGNEGPGTAEAEAALYKRLGLLPEPLVPTPDENGRVAGENGAPVAFDEAEALEGRA